MGKQAVWAMEAAVTVVAMLVAGKLIVARNRSVQSVVAQPEKSDLVDYLAAKLLYERFTVAYPAL